MRWISGGNEGCPPSQTFSIGKETFQDLLGFNPDGGFGLGHIHVDNRRLVHRNPVLPGAHERGSRIVEEGFPLKPETFRSHQVVTVNDGDESALASEQPPILQGGNSLYGFVNVADRFGKARHKIHSDVPCLGIGVVVHQNHFDIGCCLVHGRFNRLPGRTALR